jgi:hypothetical protein
VLRTRAQGNAPCKAGRDRGMGIANRARVEDFNKH